MKTEVYSWRLPEEVKSDLEREARHRGTSVSSILDVAVREWLERSAQPGDDELQAKLHAAVESCIGSIAGRNPRRAETARKLIRQRLRKRNAR